jgi:PPOX class probable F420-dependent enzyme
MSERDRIRMSPDEVLDHLAGPHKLQLATLNPDGFPHLVTMYYDVFDGRVGFWTYATAQKAVNLRRDPRLTCLVETGEDYLDLRGVQIQGAAELIEDDGAVADVGRRVYGRYIPGGITAELEPYIERQAAKRIAVMVEPERVVSWDHRKLA